MEAPTRKEIMTPMVTMTMGIHRIPMAEILRNRHSHLHCRPAPWLRQSHWLNCCPSRERWMHSQVWQHSVVWLIYWAVYRTLRPLFKPLVCTNPNPQDPRARQTILQAMRQARTKVKEINLILIKIQVLFPKSFIIFLNFCFKFFYY